MRIALQIQIAIILVSTGGCRRQQRTAASDTNPPASKLSEQQAPPGSLDSLFAEIVRTDWQTVGQWEPPSPKPSLDFIARAQEKADFRSVDLDGDGVDERIICLNYAPGQKPINQTFWIARKTASGWTLVGKTEGEPQISLGTPRSGMQSLDATWYDGGFRYTTTRYEFKNGHYVAVVFKHWSPTEGS